MAACTVTEPTAPPARRPRRLARRGTTPSERGHQRIHERTGDGPPAPAGERPTASVRQPLVLVTHATAPRLRLTRAQAHELLSEDRDGTAARVLVAPGLPGGPRVGAVADRRCGGPRGPA